MLRHILFIIVSLAVGFTLAAYLEPCTWQEWDVLQRDYQIDFLEREIDNLTH